MNDFSLVDLFRIEVDNQLAVFTESLLQLEKEGPTASVLESLMRAAHSLKGAARLVGVKPAERLAHVMEDCFVAAQQGLVQVNSGSIDIFLEASDLLRRISEQEEGTFDDFVFQPEIGYEDLLLRLAAAAQGQAPAQTPGGERPAPAPRKAPAPEPEAPAQRDRSLRLGADRLDALVGLAGEVQVATGRLSGLTTSMIQLKRQIFELMESLSKAREGLGEKAVERAVQQIRHAEDIAGRCSEFVTTRLEEIESYDRRMYALSSRLHQAVVSSRMCPFGEGVLGFPRMIRDLARELDKEVELVIEGRTTTVDRDVLERIESPLNHLLRNAVDHGIESREEREAKGKPALARITLRASHRSGMLALEVIDDGRGIDLDVLRESVVQKGLTSADMANRMSNEELVEFLYLPKFSTKSEVTTISGRGVGLDVVRNSVVELGGRLQLDYKAGQGAHFLLMLPLTLSVSRNLLTDIAGEIYAFPLNRISSVSTLLREEISELQGKSLFTYRGHRVPLVTAHQILELPAPDLQNEDMCLVILSKGNQHYGLVVDGFLGEQDLVVQTLDGRFGKLKNVAAGSILEDGSPVLILDVEDLHLSIERICEVGRLDNVRRLERKQSSWRARRILVVDDSITVREVERKILELKGYEVDVAVDGMDGWHAVRSGTYDLVISDVDMPRMDGIKLVSSIRSDPRLKGLPVMIVSYKDRQEDRVRGLEAGADYYLTKSSFDDDTFIKAVYDLIGGDSA